MAGAGLAAAFRPVAPAAIAPMNLVDAGASPASGPLADAEPVRTCSIDGEADSALSLSFTGLVVDADTGEVRYQRGPEDLHPTASVMKLVTAATALLVLGPDARFTTSVYPGDAPNSVVLVGGGDPVLKSGPQSLYPIAGASLTDLAAGVSASRVGIDSSMYSGPTWLGSWNESDRRDGYISDITPLMVDAGRTVATSEYSPRSATPDRDAGTAYAALLGASLDRTVHIAPGSAPLAQVSSPTVRDLVHTMLLDSDNVIAEQLARQSAIALGTGSDFAAIDAAQHHMFEQLGIDAAGFSGVDGSGLSADNRASAQLIVDLLGAIDSQAQGLGEIEGYLPENQVTGTLDTRLAGVPAGAIRAKTGWIDQVFALAGVAQLADGSRIRFALFVTEPAGSSQITTPANRDALDAIATAMWNCGTGLAAGRS